MNIIIFTMSITAITTAGIAAGDVTDNTQSVYYNITPLLLLLQTQTQTEFAPRNGQFYLAHKLKKNLCNGTKVRELEQLLRCRESKKYSNCRYWSTR